MEENQNNENVNEQNVNTTAPSEVVPATEEVISEAETVIAPEALKGAVQNPVQATEVKPAKKKMGFLKYILAGVGALVVIAAVVVAIIILNNPYRKIEKAFTNTLSEIELFDKNQAFKAGKGGTVEVSCSIEGIDIDGTLASTGDKLQLSMSLDGKGFDDLDLSVMADQEKLYASLPLMGNQYYSYNYVKPGKGDLDDLFSASSIEKFNDTCKELFKTSSELSNRKDYEEAYSKFAKTITLKDAKPKKFKVEGEKKEVEGYKLKIKGTALYQLAKDLSLASLESLSSSPFVDSYNMDLSNLEEIKNMSFDVNVYIEGKKLAAVILTTEYKSADVSIEVLFEGKSFRCQDMIINLSQGTRSEEIATISIEHDGSEETFNFVFNNEYKLRYTYDSKTGEIGLHMIGSDRGREKDYINIEGKLKSSKNSIEFALDSIKVEGEKIKCDFSMTTTNSGKIKKYSGKEIKVDELDIEELQDELTELITEYGKLFTGKIF